VVLEDPAVDSLSSFIGVDGTNATLNSGRMLINLKPHGRAMSRPGCDPPRQPSSAAVPGVTLYMQPVQDLTIEDRVSRTQYQFRAGADPGTLAHGCPSWCARLQQLPQLADVASDLQDQGLQAYIEIDRDKAAALGVTTAAIDNALYDAFGQRDLHHLHAVNQYRVVLEVAPNSSTGPRRWTASSWPPAGGRCRCPRWPPSPSGPLAVNHIGQFPAATISFNLAKGASLGRRCKPSRRRTRSACLLHHHQLPGRGAGLPGLAVNPVADPGGHRDHVHRAGRALRELHPPITILSTCPRRVGALLALLLSGTDLA
jgi:multidrug efflux pump